MYKLQLGYHPHCSSAITHIARGWGKIEVKIIVILKPFSDVPECSQMVILLNFLAWGGGGGGGVIATTETKTLALKP